MTREEIEEFSGVEPYCFETDREEDWYKIGCIDGLDAADADPDTSSLWHSANEEPEDKDLKILLETKSGCYWVGSGCITSFFCDNWQKYAEDVALTRWVYIKDLIPKGGEK